MGIGWRKESQEREDTACGPVNLYWATGCKTREKANPALEEFTALWTRPDMGLVEFLLCDRHCSKVHYMH